MLRNSLSLSKFRSITGVSCIRLIIAHAHRAIFKTTGCRLHALQASQLPEKVSVVEKEAWLGNGSGKRGVSGAVKCRALAGL